jgi:hypothetical protein
VLKRVTLAEAFYLLLRALLRTRGLGEEVAGEVNSYEWFRHPEARQRHHTPEDLEAATEAHNLLDGSIRAGKLTLFGIRGPGVPLTQIDQGELELGPELLNIDVFANALKLYWSDQSLEVARTYAKVVCIEADVLALIPGAAPISGAEKMPEESPPAAQEFRPAPDKIIRNKISDVYQAAKEAGEPPPNIKKLPGKVRPLLRAEGFDCSFQRIANIGQEKAFSSQRRKPGPTLKSEGKRPRK